MPKAHTWACLSGDLPHALEELGVLVVRERIAPFDEVEAQFVQPLSHQQLVLQREADALALAAVAERGVVDLNATHGGPQLFGRNNVSRGSTKKPRRPVACGANDGSKMNSSRPLGTPSRPKIGPNNRPKNNRPKIGPGNRDDRRRYEAQAGKPVLGERCCGRFATNIGRYLTGKTEPLNDTPRPLGCQCKSPANREVKPCRVGQSSRGERAFSDHRSASERGISKAESAHH